MKKTIRLLAILFSAIILFSLCSCKTRENTDLTSSTSILKETSPNEDNSTDTQLLLRRISANGDLNTIESIIVREETCTDNAPFMDKENFDFLQKYSFSHTKTDKRENWYGWLKENSTLTLTVTTKTQGDYLLYLIQDGSIAIQEMCGDSEAPEITYEFYKAETQDVLTKENINLILSQ